MNHTLRDKCNVCGKTDCKWIQMSPEYFGKITLGE